MRTHVKLILATACLWLLCAGALRAEEREVKLEQVPAAAQRTIQARVTDETGKITEIDLVTEDGETSYDVTLTKGKQDRTFSVSPDGKLLSWQVFMPEIPEAARKAIREHVRNQKGKLGDIDRVMDDGKTAFDVTMTKGEKETSFSVSESGKLLTMEITLEEAPEVVQKTIRAKLGDSVIKTLEKNTEDEDGDVVYDVEATKGGKKISFSVDAGGKLVED